MSGGQEHTGLWLITWHLALKPQVPTQGSEHFWLMHAIFRLHSALTTHSGLQLGGAPKYPSRQEQAGRPSTTRQMLFGPQAFGSQGLIGLISKQCRNPKRKYSIIAASLFIH